VCATREISALAALARAKYCVRLLDMNVQPDGDIVLVLPKLEPAAYHDPAFDVQAFARDALMVTERGDETQFFFSVLTRE
jgi:hypothetical protein